MFLPYLRAQSGRLAAAYSMSLLGVLLALALPWPLKYIIDGVLRSGGQLSILRGLSADQQLAVLASAMAVLAVIATLVQSAGKILHARVRERFSYRLRDDLVQQIYGLSRRSRQAEMSGELTMRLVSDSQLVSRLFCKTIPEALKHVMVAIVTLLSIFLINFPIGLAGLLMAALLTLIVVSYGPRLARAAKEKRAKEGYVSAHTQETINGIEHIQAMALEAQSRQRYLNGAAASLHAGVEEVRTAVQLERRSQILAGISLALVTGGGGLLVLRGSLSLGTLTVCLAYISQLLKPIEKINEISTSISRGIVRAQRLRKLFDAEVTPATRDGETLTSRIRHIDCNELTFCYADGDTPIVSDFSYSFRIGECTAIVGPSGCGKSTLLRLLLGLQSPSGGSLSANGSDYGELNTTALRAQAAVLFQDSHLFAGSIRQIVTEVNGTATDDMIRAVLHDVYLSHVVDALPLGLETSIDEAGARFSVGQRARLLLARALLSERPVLLLDEPFANLDDESRRIVLRCLTAAKQSRILIIVTHEQALLDVADRVLTPDDFQHEQQAQDNEGCTTTKATNEVQHASALA